MPRLPRTVVLLGDVGVGKSRLAEMVSGRKGLSSAAKESYTRHSEAFTSMCGQLLLIDTPGYNPMKEKFQHNVWIAHAFNFRPVSLILIVVKSDVRKDTVVDDVRKFADKFWKFSPILGVCVTHMDISTKWQPQELQKDLDDQLAVNCVVFSSREKQGEALTADILNMCKADPQNISIDSKNFLQFFQMHKLHRSILMSVKREQEDFQAIVVSLEEQLPNFHGRDKLDLLFEFQAYMLDVITEAQQRVAEEHRFDFTDKSKGPEHASHIAWMANQMKETLFKVRIMTLGYANDHGCSQGGSSALRRCPHCGEVWLKTQGCDGLTTCGNMVSCGDSDSNVKATFSFEWTNSRLIVHRTSDNSLALDDLKFLEDAGFSPQEIDAIAHNEVLRAGALGHLFYRRRVPQRFSGARHGRGCGRSITWTAMAPVTIPEEFGADLNKVISVEDVPILPADAMKAWEIICNEELSKKDIKVNP